MIFRLPYEASDAFRVFICLMDVFSEALAFRSFFFFIQSFSSVRFVGFLDSLFPVSFNALIFVFISSFY